MYILVEISIGSLGSIMRKAKGKTNHKNDRRGIKARSFLPNNNFAFHLFPPELGHNLTLTPCHSTRPISITGGSMAHCGQGYTFLQAPVKMKPTLGGESQENHKQNGTALMENYGTVVR